MSTIHCESIESMVKIITMLVRENIIFTVKEDTLIVEIKGY